MGQTVYFVKTIKCRNGVEEKTKYPVRMEDSWDRRERKRAARRENKRLCTAEHQAARWLNMNFDAGKDVHLVLEYSEAGLAKLAERAAKIEGRREEDALFLAAQQDLANFVRRVQRVMGAAAFRYLGCTSDRSWEDGELRPARLHHHFVCCGEALELCRKKWTAGFVLEKELHTVKGDFHALAEYMLRQVRQVRGAKRYVPSRNLEKPIESEPKQVTRGEESNMRVPRGCIEIYHSEYSRGATQYMRYIRPLKGGGDDDGLRTYALAGAGQDRADAHIHHSPAV